MTEIDSFLKIFLSVESLLAFLFIIAPGFISLRAYESGSGHERRAATESLVDIAMYSFASDVIWIPIFKAAAQIGNPVFRTIFLVLCGIGIIATAIGVGRGWYSVQVWLANTGATVDPTPKPWDKFFKRHHNGDFGVVLTLADGRKIGGRFGEGFASSYPADEQIHVAEPWVLDQETGAFLERASGSLGFIIDNKDILTVELFDWSYIESNVQVAPVTAPGDD